MDSNLYQPQMIDKDENISKGNMNQKTKLKSD